MKNIYSEKQKTALQKFSERENDWRNGSIVYQVIVDRFVQPENLAQKEHYYAYPRKLKPWTDIPLPGEFLPDYNVWSHEIDFWGGDIPSLRSRLDYLAQLGIDVLYLNPIHSAFTNHKYDATDYLGISPEYGSENDLADLIADLRKVNMRLVLDGVFNHMGRNSDFFKEAISDVNSIYREWFYFGAEYPQGVRLWANAKSLPELNLENPAVRNYIYAGEDSVIRKYLRLGVDGWRLDTAFELGFNYLAELTDFAHKEKSGSLVVGEIWNYPADWFPALDGVMNFTLREIIMGCLSGRIKPALAGEMIAKMIAESGIEPMLKSWIVLDNHDVPRITKLFPDTADRRIAQVLQFTLPGSPNLYYGSELGMDGDGDPSNRAPMRWDLTRNENQVLTWMKNLINVRKDQRALKIGDYRGILTDQLLAFERYTDRVDETVIVIINPTEYAVEENVLVPDSNLMNGTELIDLMGSDEKLMINSSILRMKMAAKTYLVLKPLTHPVDGYSPYKRIN